MELLNKKQYSQDDSQVEIQKKSKKKELPSQERSVNLYHSKSMLFNKSPHKQHVLQALNEYQERQNFSNSFQQVDSAIQQQFLIGNGINPNTTITKVDMQRLDIAEINNGDQGADQSTVQDLALVANNLKMRILKYGDLALKNSIAKLTHGKDLNYYDTSDPFIDDEQYDKDLKCLAICHADIDDYHCFQQGGMAQFMCSEIYQMRLKDIDQYRDTKSVDKLIKEKQQKSKERRKQKRQQQKQQQQLLQPQSTNEQQNQGKVSKKKTLIKEPSDIPSQSNILQKNKNNNLLFSSESSDNEDLPKQGDQQQQGKVLEKGQNQKKKNNSINNVGKLNNKEKNEKQMQDKIERNLEKGENVQSGMQPEKIKEKNEKNTKNQKQYKQGTTSQASKIKDKENITEIDAKANNNNNNQINADTLKQNQQNTMKKGMKRANSERNITLKEKQIQLIDNQKEVEECKQLMLTNDSSQNKKSNKIVIKVRRSRNENKENCETTKTQNTSIIVAPKASARKRSQIDAFDSESEKTDELRRSKRKFVNTLNDITE